MLFDCPAGHPLISVNFARYTRKWSCNCCKQKWKGTEDRWRCVENCNYDVCKSCAQPLLSRGSLTPQTETLLLLPSDGILQRGSFSKHSRRLSIQHKHSVASVEFDCTQCGTVHVGFRMYCPQCLYNLCRSCTVKQMLGHSDSDEVDSIDLGPDPKPFAVGASREAYRVNAAMRDGRRLQLVLKTWKRDFLNEGYEMAETVRIHLEAHRISEIYRKMFATNRPIRFYKPTLYTIPETIQSGESVIIEKGETVVLETFIDGEFEKFNSNSGWSSKNHRAPDAFTHFTWHHTKSLIVCDLEGHRRVKGDANDGYYLTDPAICSLTKEWGFTDLGTPGIANFFRNHDCNDLCRDWDVPDLAALSTERPLLEQTTYIIPRKRLATVEIDIDEVSTAVAASSGSESTGTVTPQDSTILSTSSDHSETEEERITRKKSVSTAGVVAKFQKAIEALNKGENVSF